MQQNQEAITKQLSQPAETEGDPSATKTYAGLTKDVNDRIAELEKGIKAERDKLDEHEKNIDVSVSQDLGLLWSQRRRQGDSSYATWKDKYQDAK